MSNLKLEFNWTKSLTVICLGLSGRYILITCDIHWSLWLVSVYRELQWLNEGNLRRTSLLSRAAGKISGFWNCLQTAPPYPKVVERRGILSFNSIIHYCNERDPHCFDPLPWVSLSPTLPWPPLGYSEWHPLIVNSWIETCSIWIQVSNRTYIERLDLSM